MTAEVRWGGGFVTQLTATRTPDAFPPPFTPAWQPFEATVIGQAGSTLLEFDSQTGNFCGITLDAVSVTLIQDGGDDDGDDEGDDDDDDDGGEDDD